MQALLANCVRQYRQATQLTQQELATKIGVTRQTIIALEKGNYIPSVLLALKLARALDKTVEVLFSANNLPKRFI